MKELTAISKIKEIMRKHNFKIKKSYGQNFLINESVVEKILDSAHLQKSDVVVEVGPGLGTLTQGLAARAGGVLAVELDRTLLPILTETLAGYKNVRVINADILKLDLDQAVAANFPDRRQGKYKVVANLPYYITTPIIMHLLEHQYRIESMVIMVQREVAERMVANPGGKDYGALSVAIQYYTEASLITHVPASSFLPAPDVASAVIKLKMREKPAVTVQDEVIFFQVVKGAFAQRRKTLLNALNNKFGFITKGELLDILDSCGIEGSRRGETLSLEEFARLADGLWAFRRAN
ncbi:16S rRNA (adenine(1518)-N(6)/adenine(1519)-N(6))-dimethyltransferase RsmA [Zhaonella formicivorans]|uniref:16S rRNA (adenine(1518)-N(6)/adenine(1519)-N(6))- dimethyltransferase RsmA n=1 Tax=Zhaonella formicivorans TaxID=2528593 RepID=UPI001D0F8EE6|nr:16S rRNA (adenine(1518)-N(6)/adenine(1519)-N(6))-dimethyltransferase RsmA [Zhaonella formicivorans]